MRLSSIFDPIEMQILYQFSMRLTCPLLNIVNTNLKIQKDIPFSSVCLYFFEILLHSTVSDDFRSSISMRELFVNISKKLS